MLIITEGEIDALSCCEVGINYVVSIPDGANTSASFPVGTHQVTLTVTDDDGDGDVDGKDLNMLSVCWAMPPTGACKVADINGDDQGDFFIFTGWRCYAWLGTTEAPYVQEAAMTLLDPDRIPVVFVHGALGYPQQFESLIEGLDRELATTYNRWAELDALTD